jgi:flagellar biosynthetic protein FliR
VTIDGFALAGMVTPWVYGALLVFCRLGAAFMLMPGLGEAQIPVRARLVAALAVSRALAPAIDGVPLPVPADAVTILVHVFGNIIAGALLGAGARLLLSALHVAAQAAAQQMGLSNPFTALVPGFEGASALSSFFVMCGVAVTFAADLHHLLIQAVAGSFRLVPIDGIPDGGLQAQAVIRVASQAMRLAVQFAAPFLVIGLVGNVGLGITNRMMQALPVYFVFSPLLLGTGLVLAFLVAGAMIGLYADAVGDWLLGGGMPG